VLSDTEVADLVGRELQPWENDLRPLWDVWNKSWAKWGVQPVADDDPFLSKVQSNYPTYAVEVILPRLLGEEPSMSYRAVDDDSDDVAATLLGKVVSYQMKRMGFEYAARDFVRQALVTNYSCAKVGWKRLSQIRTVQQREEHPIADGLGSATVVIDQPQSVVVCNEPFFEVVNNFDFVWPLYAKNLCDATAVWQRRWIKMRDLRDLQKRGVYTNVDQLTAADTGRWTEAYQPQFDAQRLSPTNPVAQVAADDPDALVEIHERWEDDRLTVVAGRRVCLRDEPNPFWHKQKPFVDFTPIPRPFQLHGVSILQTINDSNESLSTLMRQVTDSLTYMLNPAWKATQGIDLDEFVLRPGAALTVDDTEDVAPLTMPNIDIADALQWREAHINDMERYSGVFEYGSGNFPQAGSHTATGVASVIQEGMKRLTEMVNVLAYRTMRPFGRMMESMNAQYLDAAVLVDFTDDPKAQEAWAKFKGIEQPVGPFARMRDRMTGGEKPPTGRGLVDPEMVKATGRLDPIPQVGQDKTLSDTQKRSDVTQALQAVAPILASPQNPLNMKALADWALKGMGMPEEDRTKVLQTPPVQQMAAVTDATGGQPVASGPGGGDNRSMGGVVGFPGAAGGSGPPGAAG